MLSIEIKTCKSYKLLNIISRYQRWEVIQILSDCTYVDFFTFYFSCLHLNKKHLHFLLLSFSNQPRYFSFNAFKGNYYVYCIYIYIIIARRPSQLHKTYHLSRTAGEARRKRTERATRTVSTLSSTLFNM